MADLSTDRCESCGADRVGADDLATVQRVYVVAHEAGTLATAPVTVRGDIEAWCFVCRTMYPHEPVTAS